MAPKTTTVEANTHKDQRVNIPTQELSDFMSDEQKAPKTLLYPRDPSLDPQLVWQGKDEQDSADLAVEARPVYIQETIHPKTIIDNVQAQAKKNSGQPTQQLDLFADFNDIEFDQQIEFYQHPQHWRNRLILGDSLQVMASLAEKEGLKGQVQMIYLDPPYGIKFGSNWQVSTRKRDVKDSKVDDLTRQPEQVKAFRDTWELGIHSYLAYLRDRLVVARELLTETGSVFVQISDENVHLVRCLLDEVFGSQNFGKIISVQKTGGLSQTLIPGTTDFIIWYGKDITKVKYRQLYFEKEVGENSLYQMVELPAGHRRRMTKDERVAPNLLPSNSKVFRYTSLESANPTFAFGFQDKVYKQRWKTNAEGLRRLHIADRIYSTGRTLQYRRYQDDFPVIFVTNNWTDTGSGSFLDPQIYVVQTVTKVIQRCLLMTTDPGDLVLDPTCGSGTTAYVAEQWGRRWITTDTSRVALALARTRLMSAKFPYYTLADSPDGIKLESELRGQFPPQPLPPTDGDLRRGFVYQRVPHIMLKDIANNPEIDDIHARWQEKLEPIQGRLNTLLKQQWADWELPREPEPAWPLEAKKLLEQWWQHRRQRQTEIDESIGRNSDQEILYDQPYETKNTVRVTGPFTVESLSPHRVLSQAQPLPASQQEAKAATDAGQFEQMIIDNLRKAGVQNTKKGERLKFDRLEIIAGEYIQAEGEYTEKDGSVKQVALCIGPEHGTVSKHLMNAAAREAVKGIGYDLLLVCGFAFEADVTEEARQMGKITVLPVRMNPDLSMGDTLLKKTGSGNLFMIFGEPDLKITRTKAGQVVVKLHGLDIYDPTTGQIRSSSTDDIACWFIDTNYDEKSFFVRHAYFTGADEPYDQLKRALRAEIDETAWSDLYRTESMPFDPPESGKIAVKVINHYGDEVLNVYKV